MDHHQSLPSPRLPTEICDYILDHLWDDHKTLKVCSLVTREWLPTTRKHIFSFVSIINLRLVTFAEMIMHSGDALALCVRRLFLLWSDLDKGDSPFRPIPTFVPRMLASLGRLEELTLHYSVWDANCYSSAEATTWPVLPMVKALYLNIGTLNDVISLQRFICACPSLSSLKLWITSQSDGSHTHSPTVIPRSILIDIFQCSVRESDPVLEWLLQDSLKLRARRLAITAAEDLASVNFLKTGDAQGLLRASGERLKHLLIILLPMRQTLPATSDGQKAALAHNPNLVSVYVLDVSWSFPSGWPSLLSILADIQPMHTRLRSIDITFFTTRESDITRMPCEQLDAALARIVYTHPRLILAVWIRCDCDEPMPWLAEFVQALLQGLVRVQAGRSRLCLMWLNGHDENREFSHHTKPSWYRR